MDSPQTPRHTALAVHRRSPIDFGEARGVARWMSLGLALVVLLFCACQRKPEATPVLPPAANSQAAAPKPAAAPPVKIELAPFNFQISSGADQYQIEGFIALPKATGPLPAVLVLNGDRGNARECIDNTKHFVSLGMQVACISLPGYGKSSGPSRFVGEQAVAAARRALDLLAARADVDPARMAVWGLADGAVAAGLLMDSDTRLRAVILQSGAYDMLKLWPEAPLGTKLSILRQVWPSKRVLRERSVIEHLPAHLQCSVLILHGARDRRMPIVQAEQLAQALAERGAHVETHYFPKGAHDLGRTVDLPLRNFLLDNLISPPSVTP
jgi:predicted esterase